MADQEKADQEKADQEKADQEKADQEKAVHVQEHMRSLRGFNEDLGRYMGAIAKAAMAEGLDDGAALRIGFAFLKEYRPSIYDRLMKDLRQRRG